MREALYLWLNKELLDTEIQLARVRRMLVQLHKGENSMELRVLTPSECSLAFHQGMVDRMEVSFHKYGPVMAAKGKVDELASLKKRIEKYEATGNTEWLMDVANFAMIIYMHEGADKFRATSSEESPGLTLEDGRVSSERHTPVQAVQSDQVYKHRGD